MNAMQAAKRHTQGGRAVVNVARTGPNPPGSQARESRHPEPDNGAAARVDSLLAAMVDNTQPGDLTYARVMTRVYELVHEAASLHARMVECYEDGLTKQAAGFAIQAAECGYELADLHAEMATAFQALVPFVGQHFSAVHLHDRHPSNVPASARATLGPDPFIDMEV
jgi:hypothetical protein